MSDKPSATLGALLLCLTIAACEEPKACLVMDLSGKVSAVHPGDTHYKEYCRG